MSEKKETPDKASLYETLEYEYIPLARWMVMLLGLIPWLGGLACFPIFMALKQDPQGSGKMIILMVLALPLILLLVLGRRLIKMTLGPQFLRLSTEEISYQTPFYTLVSSWDNVAQLGNVPFKRLTTRGFVLKDSAELKDVLWFGPSDAESKGIPLLPFVEPENDESLVQLLELKMEMP